MAFHDPINFYDEGIVLSGAHELLWGKVPYRDFYSNYPPGVFLLVAAAFRVAGSSVAVERMLGVALHLAIALAAGRLAARLSGRRLSWMLVALVLTWLLPLRASASAWLAGLAVALLSCEVGAWASARGGRVRHALAGVLLGATSWFRHDLFVYFACGLCVAGGLWAIAAARRGDRTPARSVGWVALGTLASASAMWLPVLVLAGPAQPLADLFLDQVRYVAPARDLPLPPLLPLVRVGWSPIALPVFLLQTTEGAVVLTLLGPALAIGALALPRAAGIERAAGMAWLAALAAAVLPQMLGRTDLPHAIYCVAPGLIGSWLWIAGGVRRSGQRGSGLGMLAGALLLFTPAPSLPTPTRATAPPARLRRAPDIPATADQQRVVSFIEQHGKPGDPLYVGVADHRWVNVNDMDLYFLANRLGATRYMQFEPKLINREDVQRQMVQQLEASRPRVVVLAKRPQRLGEPNASEEMGASVLDAYLLARYAPFIELNEYRLGLRR